MSEVDKVQNSRWSRGRYGFAAFWFCSLLLLWFVLRLIFFLKFSPAGLPAGNVAQAFLSGFLRDCFVALLYTIPLLGWFWIVSLFRRRKSPPAPGEAPGRGRRFFVFSVSFVAAFTVLFLAFVEYFFFEEFRSRFNTVAVDYLIYPQEVFVNIWESYHVGLVVLFTAIVSAAWVYAGFRLFRCFFTRPHTPKAAFLTLVGAMGAAVLLSFTFNPKAARVGAERTLNEIANNGSLSFVVAALTRNLEYSAFYKILPLEESYARARTILAQTNATFIEQGLSIRRHISGDTNRPKYNMVILLEESLGSEFWECSGRTNSLTPEMDKLANTEGLLLTNIYACGNRTVRGMEGVLSSFPPLPGDSIVKRDQSANVETIARVLKRDGYSTLFAYGGRGVFDNMKPFAVRNGYDRFIEHNPPFNTDYPKPTFTTAWGVADEDIFQRTIEELRVMHQSGKPFFATTLSVSNHKPYTYPKGRIPEDPDKQRRAYAVRYSDYCLGRFFEAAKKEPFWTNTIFAVVADHGARVYGKQSIPIHSYEIPVLIAGPCVVKKPERNGQLGGSLDVGPTLLGMLGRPYDSMFFGRDLLKMAPPDGRAYLNHNRDIGMLANERLVVLGLMQTVEFYAGDPKKEEMVPLQNPTAADRELEKDTIAIFQVADDLYTHLNYKIDDK